MGVEGCDGEGVGVEGLVRGEGWELRGNGEGVGVEGLMRGEGVMVRRRGWELRV